MFAVVRQDAIATFTQPRARTLNYFFAIEDSSVVADPDCVAMREALKRNVFHRCAPESACEAGVVNDTAIANVDAVMCVQQAWCDEMRRNRRLRALSQ